MKRLIYSLFISAILTGQVYAAAPSRTYTYTGGSTISSTEVNTNENSLYTYLQNGVDTIADGSVTNDDINASAGITYSKLNLTGSVVYGDLATATKTSIQNLAYPVGAVFLSVVSTNPATLLGYGTWTQIAQGKMLIGQNSSDSDFDTAEETGGSKTHTLLTTEIPVGIPLTIQTSSAAAGSAVNAVGNTNGGGQAHSILNPYLVVYVWKRVS